MDPQESRKLNNQLLAAEVDEKKQDEPVVPKRNSKEDLICKIHKVVDQYELEFPLSDTKLKRMNKQQLVQCLAKQVEEGVKCDMARSVGVDPRANGKAIGLGALRMIHNIAAAGFEKSFNMFGPGLVGYRLDGFTEGLQDPTSQQAIDACLTEIARESPEILDYFESAWARLGLVWMGVCLTTMRANCLANQGRVRIGLNNMSRNNKHASDMGSSPN